MIDTLCIIGVGLIGGSLARALRDAGLVRRVVGCGRDPGNLARAIELGVIDHAESDPAKAVAGADMVVVAVTLGATQDILSRIAPALDPAAIVTDVGSAKAWVVAAARATLSTAALPRFVPGHPIAGAEKSGVEASNARLFERHRVILTPIPEQSPDALSRVSADTVRAWLSPHDVPDADGRAAALRASARRRSCVSRLPRRSTRVQGPSSCRSKRSSRAHSRS